MYLLPANFGGDELSSFFQSMVFKRWLRVVEAVGGMAWLDVAECGEVTLILSSGGTLWRRGVGTFVVTMGMQS